MQRKRTGNRAGNHAGKRYLAPILAVCATALLAGPLLALAADAPPKAPIMDYEPGTIAPGEYTVIDRLWVARWRSAFDVPAYDNEDSARRALLDAAADRGGDGVVNLYCLASAGIGAGVTLGGHYCYGNVIKLK